MNDESAQPNSPGPWQGKQTRDRYWECEKEKTPFSLQKSDYINISFEDNSCAKFSSCGISAAKRSVETERGASSDQNEDWECVACASRTAPIMSSSSAKITAWCVVHAGWSRWRRQNVLRLNVWILLRGFQPVPMILLGRRRQKHRRLHFNQSIWMILCLLLALRIQQFDEWTFWHWFWFSHACWVPSNVFGSYPFTSSGVYRSRHF